jgi:hypothetical protein
MLKNDQFAPTEISLGEPQRKYTTELICKGGREGYSEVDDSERAGRKAAILYGLSPQAVVEQVLWML